MDIPVTSTNTEEISKAGAQVDTDVSFSYENRKIETEADSLQFVLIIITIVLIVIAGALFVWRKTLVSSLEAKKIEINSYEEKLSSVHLQDIKKISSKLHDVKILAEEHIFMNSILELLEKSIEIGIVYDVLDVNVDKLTGVSSVNITGTSPDYRTLVQQVDILKQDPYTRYFSDTKVSDFSLNKNGTVSFGLKITSNVPGVKPEDVNLSAANTANLEAEAISSQNINTAGDIINVDTPTGGSVETTSPVIPVGGDNPPVY